MNHFEQLKNMNIDELSKWLDKHGKFDDGPWTKWFDKEYCKNCEPIKCHYKDSEYEINCAYCELEHKCKFFPDFDDVPNNEDVIKIWLELEVDNDNK